MIYNPSPFPCPAKSVLSLTPAWSLQCWSSQVISHWQIPFFLLRHHYRYISRGVTTLPRSGGYAGAGGLRGATPRSRSGGAAMRRYPSSKVRSSSCTLLEQLWRDTHIQGKRNPSKTVGTERWHQRADRLKPQSETTIQSAHMDHSLV